MTSAAAEKLHTASSKAFLGVQTSIAYGAKRSTVKFLAKAVALKVAAVAIKVATVAMKIFNAVMMANPIFAVIGLIALLAAGIIGLVSWLSSGSSAARENARELERLSAAAERSAQAYERTKSAVQNQADSASRLTSELETLSRIENKSAADKARMQAIIAQLNGTYDGLNLAIDEEGNLIGKSTDELRDYIRTRQNAGNFEAAIQRRNDLEEQHIIIAIAPWLITKATRLKAA